MHLDLYTLGVIGLAVAVAISMSFTLLGLALRGMPALRIWAVAFWVLTAAALAQGLDEKSTVLSAIVGSGLIAFANALMLMGIAVHVRYPLRWRWPLALAALFVSIQMGFLVASPGQTIDELAFGAKSIVWDGWMIWVLLWRSPRDLRNGCRFTALVFIIDASFYLIRSGTILFPSVESHVVLANVLVMANYIFGILCSFLLSTGFTLMLAQRLTLDLRRMADTDGLTGLLNRTAVLEEGGRAVYGCRDRGQPCCVLMFDLDAFKAINDSWGHAAGDEVLKHFVNVICAVGLPKDALFARYGGEEFVLVLPGVDVARATLLAEHMRERLARQPALFERQSISVTTSVGVASAAGMGFEALVSSADVALYRAKTLGRNRVEREENGAPAIAPQAALG
jgi:diguanylate cyclase (GGDEF)-like protein